MRSVGVLRTLPRADPERARAPAADGEGARRRLGPRRRLRRSSSARSTPRSPRTPPCWRSRPCCSAAPATRRSTTRCRRRRRTPASAPTYAHTTAPLRRLVDRYVGEVCVAVSAGAEVPDWVRAALPALPETMEQSNRRAQQYEAGDHLDRRGGGARAKRRRVVRGGRRRRRRAGRRRHGPARRAGRDRALRRADLPLGEARRVRLELADVAKRQVRFELAELQRVRPSRPSRRRGTMRAPLDLGLSSALAARRSASRSPPLEVTVTRPHAAVTPA